MPEPVSATAGADEVFPGVRGCPFAEPAQYEPMRTDRPIAKVSLLGGKQAWWISRYEDARMILNDRRFSSDRRHDNFPAFGVEPVDRERFSKAPPMISMDGDEHAAERRALIGEFTVRRVAAMRPRVQQIVDEAIDTMLATDERPVDLVKALSLPVPSLVICEMLGAPYADHEYFQARSSAILRTTTTARELGTAMDELRSYLDRLITTKEAKPGDDLFSRQIAGQREARGVDHDRLVSTASLLLFAGHETTANMISLGVIGLLNNPEQLATIKVDPDKTPMAVEELLRYFTIVETATSRVAVADVEIGGVTIKAGDGVVVSGLSANWDPSVFAEPGRLDIERGARHHIAFGYGPHQCLGQNLARVELQIVFDTLFRRIPDLRLAVPVDDVNFKTDATTYGAYELPVTW